MAIEVVFNQADEWLIELVGDAGNVDRGLARVTVSSRAERGDVLETVLVSAGYSVDGVAERLEQRVGQRPRNRAMGDPDGVGAAANAEVERIEEAVRAMGLNVRPGRLVTVG